MNYLPKMVVHAVINLVLFNIQESHLLLWRRMVTGLIPRW